MRKRLPCDLGHGATAAALSAALVLAAGCGSGASSSDTGSADTGTRNAPPTILGPSTVPAPSTAPAEDQALIRAAITGALTSPDTNLACGRYVTPAYVTAAYGDDSGCEGAVNAGGQARAVSITEVHVDGDSATAVAIPHGGPNDGELVDITLLKADGSWVVDKARSNAPVGP